MKTKNAKRGSRNKAALHRKASRLNAKAVATEKLMEAARRYWRTLKMEQKQARKAFKQAKKAARQARLEASRTLKQLKRKARAAVKTARARTSNLKVGFGQTRSQ